MKEGYLWTSRCDFSYVKRLIRQRFDPHQDALNQNERNEMNDLLDLVRVAILINGIASQ